MDLQWKCTALICSSTILHSFALECFAELFDRSDGIRSERCVGMHSAAIPYQAILIRSVQLWLLSNEPWQDRHWLRQTKLWTDNNNNNYYKWAMQHPSTAQLLLATVIGIPEALAKFSTRKLNTENSIALHFLELASVRLGSYAARSKCASPITTSSHHNFTEMRPAFPLLKMRTDFHEFCILWPRPLSARRSPLVRSHSCSFRIRFGDGSTRNTIKFLHNAHCPWQKCV